MQKNHVSLLSSILVATALSGCSLIKVNGKTMSGGTTPFAASSGESTAMADDARTNQPTGGGQLVASFGVTTGPVGQAAAFYGISHEMHVPDLLLALDQLDQLAEITKVIALSQIFGIPGYAEPQVPLLAQILGVTDTIDQAKATAEVRAEKNLSNAERETLQRYIVAVAQLQAATAKSLASIASTDPGVATLLTLAQQARREWSTPDAKRDQLRAQLAALELAATSNRRSAYQGCQAKTLAAWTDAVASTKFPQFNSEPRSTTYLNPIVGNSNGALAYTALRLCRDGFVESGKGKSNLPEDASNQVRGPRTAAIARWLAAGSSIVFDDRTRDLGRLLKEANIVGSSFDIDSTISGVVAKIETKGAFAEVSFRITAEPQITCARWEKTNRIERINDNGKLEYENRCVSRASVMMQSSPDPVMYDEILVRNLKAGMFLIGTKNLPIIATAAPSSTELVYVLGAAVRK